MKDNLKFKANYIMPFLFGYDIFIHIFNDLFGKDNPITFLYGGVANSWNGGRFATFNIISLNKIKNYLKKISEEYKINPMITLSNPLISDDDLNDKYSNELLDIIYETNTYCIISSEKLYNHIKQRYPDAKVVCSVISAILNFNNNHDAQKEANFYNQMLDKYDYVVLRPEFALENIQNLNKLIIDPKRTEILVNASCKHNCPHSKIHHKMMSAQKNKLETMKKVAGFCPIIRKEQFQSLRFNDGQMQTLVEQGVNNFKLSGRDVISFDVLYEDIYEYLFKNTKSTEEIRQNFDESCARLIQKNRLAALAAMNVV